jgi:hypothetical protein
VEIGVDRLLIVGSPTADQGMTAISSAVCAFLEKNQKFFDPLCVSTYDHLAGRRVIDFFCVSSPRKLTVRQSSYLGTSGSVRADARIPTGIGRAGSCRDDERALALRRSREHNRSTTF